MEILIKEYDGLFEKGQLGLGNETVIATMDLPEDIKKDIEKLETTLEKIMRVAKYVEHRNSRVKAMVAKSNSDSKPFKIRLWFVA